MKNNNSVYDWAGITVIGVLLLVFLSMLSLDYYFDTRDHLDLDFKKVEYSGHSYVILEKGNESGIAHDPDCPCQWFGYGLWWSKK